MGIHQWLVEWVKPKGYDPYAAFRSYESYPYLIYAGIIIILFTIWLIWNDYRNETPEEKAQRKKENKEERGKNIILGLIVLSVIALGWSLSLSCHRISYCFPVFLIAGGIAILLTITYFIYKIYKKKKQKQNKIITAGWWDRE